MPEVINDFRGKYRFLSNFYNCHVMYEDVVYPNSECAFQAYKTPFPQERVQFETMRADRAKR